MPLACQTKSCHTVYIRELPDTLVALRVCRLLVNAFEAHLNTQTTGGFGAIALFSFSLKYMDQYQVEGR